MAISMLLYFMETIYWQTDTVSYQFANKERFVEKITRSQKTYPAFSCLSLSWFEPLFHSPLYFIYLLFLTTSYYFFLSSSTSSSYHCLPFLSLPFTLRPSPFVFWLWVLLFFLNTFTSPTFLSSPGSSCFTGYSSREREKERERRKDR